MTQVLSGFTDVPRKFIKKGKSQLNISFYFFQLHLHDRTDFTLVTILNIIYNLYVSIYSCFFLNSIHLRYTNIMPSLVDHDLVVVI